MATIEIEAGSARKAGAAELRFIASGPSGAIPAVGLLWVRIEPL
jgi:hypothetical protein